MKAKHLLFISLFLSMGFAACTNEVEEFGIQQTPSEAANGIELGEGFKINVAYNGVEADADTRAVLERNEKGWKASWQTNDQIGAAMYSMVKGKYTSGENAGKITGLIHFLNDDKYYASNNSYVYSDEGDGTTFTSQSNAMVGAYMLYYPFNDALNKAGLVEKIPVYTTEGKATDELKFKVDNIGEEVTNRIFAANVAYFDEGGSRATKFTVKQVPNIYMIKFSIEPKLLMKLDAPFKINQIFVEANNGSKIFNINGTVAPEKIKIEDLRDLDLIDTPKDPAKPEGEKFGLGDIAFKGTDKSESLIIEPIYSENEALNAEYAIDVVGEDGKTEPFFFSALPLDEATVLTDVTFTVVGEVNGVQKVYSKTYNSLWGENWGKLTALMKGMGETINLNVKLDSDHAASKVYTVDQFMAEYNAGKTDFNFARELELTTNITKTVTFSGKPVKINGDVIAHGETITFNNYVDVTGKVDAKTTKKKVSGVDTDVEGIVEFKGNKTVDEVVCSAKIGGNLTVDGAKSKITATNKINAIGKNITATNSAKIEIASAEVAAVASTNSIINFANIKATSITTTGGEATIEKGNVTSAEATDATVTLGNGFVVDTDFTANNSTIALDANVKGTFKATDSKIAGNPIVGTMNLIGSITDKTTNINNAGTITADVNSVLNVSELTATTVDVYGVATATKVGTIGTLNVQPLAEVTLTGANAKSSHANVNVLKNETTGKFGTLNVNTKLPVEIIVNNGIINANNAIIAGGENAGTITGTFALAGEFTQKGVADGTTITVEKDAALTISANTNVAALTNNGTVNVEGKYALTFAAASNAGTINVAGTMVEGAADALTMTADAIINAQKGATLTMNSTSKKIGTVNVFNGCKELSTVPGAFEKVCFEWIGASEPDTKALAVANNIYLNGAKIAAEPEVNAMQEKDKTYIFTGNCAIEANVKIATGKNGSNYSTVIFDGEDINITSKAGATLTLAGVKNTVKNPSKVTLGKGVNLAGTSAKWDGSATAIKSALHVENGALLIKGEGTITTKYFEIVHD